MDQPTIEVLLQPEMLAVYSFTLTQLAKNLKVPSKYLPYIAIGVSTIASFVLALPVETLSLANETFKGFGIGLATTMLVNFSKEFKINK